MTLNIIQNISADGNSPMLMNDELNRIRRELANPITHQNSARTIALCRKGLTLLERKQDPHLWASFHSTLGFRIIQQLPEELEENLEQAICHFKQALLVWTPENNPQTYAKIKHNLGLAYSFRNKDDRAANIDQAIACLEEAWSILPETQTDFWAGGMETLGKLYSQRFSNTPDVDQEKALRYFSLAAQVRTKKQMPDQWADIMYELGSIYFLRLQGERADNIERAIAHYAQALEVRTRETMPLEWARTMVRLGDAYEERIRGNRAADIETAIECYVKAVMVLTKEKQPSEWAHLMMNLGIAYRNRIKGIKAENRDRTIKCYEHALEVFTINDHPVQWARCMMNLGIAYRSRIKGDPADNIEHAIDCYQQALRIRIRKTFPVEWALTMTNLAAAYRSRIKGTPAENNMKAIDCYRQALEVQSRTAMPRTRRQTLHLLGNLYFEMQHWQKALEYLLDAIEIDTALLEYAFTEHGRQAEVKDTVSLYTDAAFCALKDHKYDQALVLLDTGKTRLLREKLEIGNIDNTNLPSEQIEALQALNTRIQILEQQYQASSDASQFLNISNKMETLRSEYLALRQQARQEYPDTLESLNHASDICVQIPVDCTLIAPLITSQGSAVFLVPHGVTTITSEYILMLTDIKLDQINDVLFRDGQDQGWLTSYFNYIVKSNDEEQTVPQEALNIWFEAIDRIPGQLWHLLAANVHNRFVDLRYSDALVLPQAGLGLIPFQAIWRDVDGEKHYLVDDVSIQYAPSASVLNSVHRRVPERYSRDALVVGVRVYKELEWLHFAEKEAELVKDILENHGYHVTLLCNEQATRQAILPALTGKAYIHLACHGEFRWMRSLESAFYVADDEPIKLGEVMSNTRLQATRLVTLSACETGITDVMNVAPDEFIGFSTGLLQAGASGVISSLWTVNDQSTSLLMTQFYNKLFENDTEPAKALRLAQLWLRKKTWVDFADYYKSLGDRDTYRKIRIDHDLEQMKKRPYKNPFFWAPFIFNGI